MAAKQPKKPRKAVKEEEPLREGKIVNTPDEEFNQDIGPISDDSMMLPNPGDSFEAEEVQEDIKEEEAEDRALFAGSTPTLVQALIQWLDEESKGADSIQVAKDLVKAEGVSLEVAIEALNLFSKVALAKKVYIQDIYDTVEGKGSQ